jgi:hypothetical protein
MPTPKSHLWPVWPFTVFALAAVGCTPGTSIGTDDYITGAAPAAAHVRFEMTRAPATATAAAQPTAAAKVVLPIRAIVLAGATSDGVELFSCPATGAGGCAVDFADDAAVAALFASTVDVPAGAYDAVQVRAASPSGATVALALSSPVTLAAGEDAQIALRFTPEQLQHAFEVAALYAPRHQVDAR